MARSVPARAFVLLLVSTCACGCGIPADRGNTDCNWIHDTPVSLNPQNRADERHVVWDATIAEELAIRYADAHRGFRSGHYVGQREYAYARNDCQAVLLDAIGTTHGVDPEYVRSLLHRRPVLYDIAVVILPMAVLFWMVADFVVRRIFRRFTVDEMLVRLVSLLLASVVLDLLAYQAGTVWSMISEEELRLHSNHLSYRAFYLPWLHHPILVFVAGMVIFWTIVLVRSRQAEPHGAVVS